MSGSDDSGDTSGRYKVSLLTTDSCTFPTSTLLERTRLIEGVGCQAFFFHTYLISPPATTHG